MSRRLILATAAKVEDWRPVAMAEPEVVEAAGESPMQRYVQRWPRVLSMQEWLAKAHPDVTPLPWYSDDGREICSLSVSPHTGGVLVELYDARGREAVRSGDYAAIGATTVAVGAKLDQLTFLPVAAEPKLTVVR